MEETFLDEVTGKMIVAEDETASAIEGNIENLQQACEMLSVESLELKGLTSIDVEELLEEAKGMLEEEEKSLEVAQEEEKKAEEEKLASSASESGSSSNSSSGSSSNSGSGSSSNSGSGSSSNSSSGSSSNSTTASNTSGSTSGSSSSTTTSPESFVANLSVAKSTTSVIVVKASGSKATVTFHKKVSGKWTQTFSCSGVVGKNGITSNKAEGDKKTPAGTYSLGQAFGVSSNPGTSRSWLTVNSNHYWVDDSNSKYYNKLVNISDVTKDWNSAEHLIDYGVPYKYAIAINYNTSGVPGKGSAIFLHCMPSSGTTAGCVAVSQSNMVTLLKSIQSDTLIHIY